MNDDTWEVVVTVELLLNDISLVKTRERRGAYMKHALLNRQVLRETVVDMARRAVKRLDVAP